MIPRTRPLHSAACWLGAISLLVAVGAEASRADWRAVGLASRGPTASPDLNELIRNLESRKPAVRRTAADTLAAMGPEARSALPALRRALGTSDGVARVCIARAIARSEPRDRAATAALLAALRGADVEVRFLAAHALAAVSTDSATRVAPELTAALSDPQPEVRAAAASTLKSFARSSTTGANRFLVARQDTPVVDPAGREKPANHEPDSRTAGRGVVATEQLTIEKTESEVEKVPPAEPGTTTTAEYILKMPIDATPAAEYDPPAAAAETAAPATLDETGGAVAGQAPQPAPQPAPIPKETPPPAPAGTPVPLPETIDTPRPLSAISLNIAPREGELPVSPGALPFAHERDLRFPAGTTRGWMMSCYNWEADALCHNPLYFEEENLERYGYTRGIIQPVLSGSRFFATVSFLPYLMTARAPWECVSTLGYYRPGSCVPFTLTRPRWSWKAAVVQGGFITGMAYLIP